MTAILTPDQKITGCRKRIIFYRRYGYALTLELHAESLNATIIKYLNCHTTGKNHQVKHNGDFAKLYRLTLGSNPIKQFSKAQQLLGHFLECRFLAEYETATLKNGLRYLKVTYLTPEIPALNDDWTLDGTLKKRRKKPPKTPPKSGDEMAIKWRQNGDEVAIKWRQDGDGKTLEGAKTLGLQPVSIPLKHSPPRHTSTYPLTHAPDDEFFLNYPPAAFEFYNKELHNLIHGFGFDEDEATEHALEQVRRQFIPLAPPINIMAGIAPSFTHQIKDTTQ